ncbi:hypothetical protein Ae707Ps1_1877c [Pseudonocardia sp. Ae707_Ps1]|nr:hypothetical protein Ae707Ps1_1877c [Pseudonocardia sp. Ae707_Ps1]
MDRRYRTRPEPSRPGRAENGTTGWGDDPWSTWAA